MTSGQMSGLVDALFEEKGDAHRNDLNYLTKFDKKLRRVVDGRRRLTWANRRSARTVRPGAEDVELHQAAVPTGDQLQGLAAAGTKVGAAWV